MENDALKTYIQQCNASLQPNIALLYEASFFKIYVKFEQYLSRIFESYCIGVPSSKGYCPQRKLAFTDEEHLRAILRGDKHYIEYIKKIETDVVNITLHFFLKDIRPMLPPAMNHSIAVS